MLPSSPCSAHRQWRKAWQGEMSRIDSSKRQDLADAAIIALKRKQTMAHSFARRIGRLPEQDEPLLMLL
jgi:hypothetical protein